MNGNKEQPESDDVELFRKTLDGVTPLPSSGRIAPSPPVLPASPRKRAEVPAPVRDILSDPDPDNEAIMEFQHNGVSRQVLRRLRRGHWPVQGSLDLHGMNSDAARRMLRGFLQEAAQQGLRCVVIVHGKGWHARDGKSVLKVRTRHWLTQCGEVLAFCEAPADLGGGGAVLVLLKSALQEVNRG